MEGLADPVHHDLRRGPEILADVRVNNGTARVQKLIILRHNGGLRLRGAASKDHAPPPGSNWFRKAVASNPAWA